MNGFRIMSWLSGFLCLLLTGMLAAEDQPAVDFNQDIRPLLSDRCYKCHGPDEAKRQAGLRLDLEAGVKSAGDSGEIAVVPGDLKASAMIARITSTDPDQRMPPADSGKSLSPDEIALIEAWVKGGGEWSDHWAFITPTRPLAPTADQGWRVRNAIDLFIQARLQADNLQLEGEASRETLIRRVTLDLTGLPPTLEEIDAFLADDSPLAYEQVVDRLLRSPRYGEQMGRNWLDAARFADTHGLHLDNERSIWPYRDWVISAFNENMPFDRFTIEQLAGDLLPEPTLQQRVATGFNRCNVTTSEGGSIDEEYYVRYAVDRVETTATVWMGLTAGCAVCHDHKFDPLTQKEFYQLFSFFFSLTEKAMDGNALLPPPVVKVPTLHQLDEQARLGEQIVAIEARIADQLASFEYEEPADTEPLPSDEPQPFVWIEDQVPAGAKAEQSGHPWKFVSSSEGPVYKGEKSSTRTVKGLGQHFFTGASQPLRVGEGDRLFAYVYLDPKNPPQEIMLQFNDGSWEHRAVWGKNLIDWGKEGSASRLIIGELPKTGEWVRLEVEAAKLGLPAGAVINGWAFTQFDGTVHWDHAGIISRLPQDGSDIKSFARWQQLEKANAKSSVPAALKTILAVEGEQRNPQQVKQLLDHFLVNVYSESRALFQPLQKEIADVRLKLTEIDKAIPATLVMEERAQPRQAHILDRGQYTEKRDPVSSQVPEWLGTSPQEAPANRLGLARWLVSPTHPLTARVTVNRYWQHYFGIGLVKTSEDFGVQGERPTHPALLDWLAVEFVESGWDVKRFQKLLVMSATYRQSSRVGRAKLAVDPENRLLARGPRHRLDAEVIRDQALAVSGLLVEVIGGKSVRPYQPAGLWKPVGFGGSNTSVFSQDKGENLYRRSMYTFWKRTVPPPSMSIFDAPDRETCQVRRARTNTPLQALVLLNDVQFVEAARRLAEGVMTDGGESAEERITFTYRTVLARHPKPRELRVVSQLFADYLEEFKTDPEAAGKLLAIGEGPRNEQLDIPELAAWTMIAHLLLNLSETVTKG
jgi:hypothetical protein